MSARTCIECGCQTARNIRVDVVGDASLKEAHRRGLFIVSRTSCQKLEINVDKMPHIHQPSIALKLKARAIQ